MHCRPPTPSLSTAPNRTPDANPSPMPPLPKPTAHACALAYQALGLICTLTWRAMGQQQGASGPNGQASDHLHLFAAHYGMHPQGDMSSSYPFTTCGPPVSEMRSVMLFVFAARLPEIIPLTFPMPVPLHFSVCRMKFDFVGITRHGGHEQPWRIATLSVSPISRDDSSQWAPLQQFITSRKIREEEPPSLCIPKQHRDQTRKPHDSRCTFNLDPSIGSDSTVVTGKSCANTRDSNDAAFGAVHVICRLLPSWAFVTSPRVNLAIFYLWPLSCLIASSDQ